MSTGYRSRHHSHGTRSVRDRPPSPHPSHLSRRKSRDTTTSGSADSRFSDDDKQDEVSLLCCTIPSEDISLDSLAVRIIIGVIICILAFATGFLIGYFAMPSVGETSVESKSNARSAPICPKAMNKSKKAESRNIKLTPVYIPPDENFTTPYAAIHEVQIDNLKRDLNEIAGSTHAAWQERDQELALMIEKRWSDLGLDSVQMVKYNVLLNYPDSAHPNKVQVIEHPGKVTLIAANKERGRWKGDIDENTIDAYSAYSRSGEVKARPVYVNYGREEDFEMLARYRVDVSGTICIIRYGKISPGLKVRNAEMADAAGVILYPDPADVAPNGTDEGTVYPYSEMLPPDGIRRGSVLLEMGDPQTPFWPSIEGVYRIPLENTSVPKIIVQPISYNDAGKILDKMQGRVPPPDWIGGLRKYRMGPGFEKQRGREPTLVVTVNNIFKLQAVYNVIGMIQGREEPDRYVIEGNHRDAWSQGTSDPSSGTAQLLETVRIFAEMKKNGWRPRRTLIFASWGAEELGEMGSQEWVEEHLVELSIRGVAYINTDTCVSGPQLEISSSPLLTHLVFEATKMVSHPTKENATLFDELTNGVNMTEDDLKSEWSDNLSYDSDIGPLLYLAGIPSINVWFRRNKTENGSKNKFPTYHTAYDTLHRMTNFVDPDYRLHKACTQLSLAMILNAADSPLIPLNPTSLGQIMKKGLEHLRSEEISTKLIHLGVDIEPLTRAVEEFMVAADEWTEQLKNDNFSLALRRRLLNDQLMLLKSSLLLPEGESPNFRVRHTIYSPAIRDSYVTTTFAKIVDLLNEGPEVKIRLNIYITKVMVQIRQAISALTPF